MYVRTLYSVVVLLEVTGQRFDSLLNVSAADCCLLPCQWLTVCDGLIRESDS